MGGAGGGEDKLLILLTPTLTSPAGRGNYGLFVYPLIIIHGLIKIAKRNPFPI
jgi:hypothetical protein